MPQSAFLGSGEVVIFRKCFRKVSTPKFVSAEPKNTGESSPLLTSSMIKLCRRTIQQLDLIHQLACILRHR